MALLALAQFMVVLDSAVTNVALPAIRESLHVDEAMLAWVVTGYALTFGGFLLLGGRAADLYGRRRVLVTGLIGFATTSLLIGFAQSDVSLIALRAAQGLFAALASPAALSILLATFSHGTDRVKALSVWSMMAAGGAGVGVAVGGLLTEYAGWRWNFLINVPIGAALVYGILKTVPPRVRQDTDRRLDLPGAALITAGLMTLVYALSRSADAGWDTTTFGLLGASAVLLAGFVYNESRVKHPLVPLALFKVRNVAAGNVVMMAMYSSWLAIFFFDSLYAQQILHYSAVQTGLAFLPLPVVLGLVSSRASRIIARHGLKPVLATGLALLVAGMLWMAVAPVDGTYLVNLLPSLLLMAVGAGLAFVSTSVAATTGVPTTESGLASGVLNSSQQVGGALGLAVLSTIASSVAAGASGGAVAAMHHGYSAAFATAAGFVLVGLIVALTGLRAAPGHHATSDIRN